jgi:hypothetical protein
MCVNYNDMTLTITGRRQLSSAEMQGVNAGSAKTWVLLDVVIDNHVSATEDQELNAHDLTLITAEGLVVSPRHLYKSQYGVDTGESINGCVDWNAVIAKSGGRFGPRPLCFAVGGNPAGAMTLRWSPRVLGVTAEIALPAVG